MWDDNKYELVVHRHPTQAHRVYRLFFYSLFIRLYMLPQRAFVIKLCTCILSLHPSYTKLLYMAQKAAQLTNMGCGNVGFWLKKCCFMTW